MNAAGHGELHDLARRHRSRSGEHAPVDLRVAQVGRGGRTGELGERGRRHGASLMVGRKTPTRQAASRTATWAWARVSTMPEPVGIGSAMFPVGRPGIQTSGPLGAWARRPHAVALLGRWGGAHVV
jgi:hypothetical protein